MLLLVSLFSIGLLFIANKLFLRIDVSKYMPIAPPSASGCDESDDKGREDVPYAISRPTPNLHTSFGVQSGATVRGWPSTGGIYILESCDGVELEYLQLDRFSTSLRSKDSAEQDAHCAWMRNLGAVWWKSEYDFDEQHLLDPEVPDPGEPVVIVGWPVDGGVWVLRTTYADSIHGGVWEGSRMRLVWRRGVVLSKD